MILAMVALNFIDVRPIDREAGLCMRSGDTLVSFLESTEHCCSETMGDVEVTAVHYHIVIDGEVVFDTPKFLHWLFREAF